MNNAAASLPLMLKQLRLSIVRTHWETVAEKALNEHWSPQQYLAELCHMELANREDKRLNRYIKYLGRKRPSFKTIEFYQKTIKLQRSQVKATTPNYPKKTG